MLRAWKEHTKQNDWEIIAAQSSNRLYNLQINCNKYVTYSHSIHFETSVYLPVNLSCFIRLFDYPDHEQRTLLVFSLIPFKVIQNFIYQAINLLNFNQQNFNLSRVSEIITNVWNDAYRNKWNSPEEVQIWANEENRM